MDGCPGCFQDQRTINEKFQKAIADAKKYSKEHDTAVAVFVEGYGFIFQAYQGATPPGAVATFKET